MSSLHANSDPGRYCRTDFPCCSYNDFLCAIRSAYVFSSSNHQSGSSLVRAIDERQVATNALRKQDILTHSLMVGPAEWAIRSRYGPLNIETFIGLWQWYSAEGSIIWEVAQYFDFIYRKPCWRVFVPVTFPIICCERDQGPCEEFSINLMTDEFLSLCDRERGCKICKCFPARGWEAVHVVDG